MCVFMKLVHWVPGYVAIQSGSEVGSTLFGWKGAVFAIVTVGTRGFERPCVLRKVTTSEVVDEVGDDIPHSFFPLRKVGLRIVESVARKVGVVEDEFCRWADNHGVHYKSCDGLAKELLRGPDVA